MQPRTTRTSRTWASIVLALALAAATVALATPASAQLGPPWDGNPISAGLGPTYGEPWCADAAPGSSIANQQDFDGPAFQDTLALLPQEAIACTLDQIIQEGADAGLPSRMTYSVIGTTDAGREIYGVVVNALETSEQQRDYDRWLQLRGTMDTDPAAGQALLDSFGDEVKIPIFIEANIHGGEEEGTDAMMQVLRDLVTTPYGQHAVVDDVLDHAIVILIPSQNPDGRFLGTRANGNGFDMNRDLLVQSQPEMRANVALELEWLAPVMLAMHGYVNPTLIDGLTKPHNPGLEYDLFLSWNPSRLDANEAALAGIQQGITRPVYDYGPNGGQQANISSTGATQSGTTVTITTTSAHGLAVGQEVEIAGVGVWGYNGTFEVTSVPTPTTFTYETTPGLAPSGFGVVFTGNPEIAEGWDDWGPFYTQTYGAFFGVDGSTLEMCSNLVCGGRFGSKRAQYVGFYSSAGYWTQNRQAILDDQLEIFRRGVTEAPRPNCCDDVLVAARGFTETQHNWMVPYPEAFVIPSGASPGGFTLPFEDGQRSQAEANRLAQWLLDNGIQLHRTTKDYAYAGQTLAKHSYVVFMDQPLRGLAYTALSAGQDISTRITQLYAPPGAWSHGQLWGADTIEVPAADTFAPKVEPITSLNPLIGGVRGGGNANWYALAIKGAAEVRAVLDLLRAGIDGEVAEASFQSASAGAMPAGSVLFAKTDANVAALASAGLSAGIYFERVLNAAKPATTDLTEAPEIAVLVNSAAPAINDTMWSLQQIFGSDVRFVSVVNGTNSLQNAAVDPLADIDVIYNTGQQYPSATNAIARQRLQDFFARGGGYIATGVSGNNATFLTGAGLVGGSFTLTNASAGGGIGRWDNDGGIGSPLTGAYPAQDFLYLPSNINYFSAIPTGAVVDGTYPSTDAELFVAGLWRDRTTAASLAALNATVILHGDTLVGSRYLGLAVNPFSRGDAEREWALIGQAALWSNLTDEL
ncbi:MAG: hypothetical protein L0206_06115 [Actinobacteria bacterium]|nr:hypothetical protein [Actinomycetota bacterium]